MKKTAAVITNLKGLREDWNHESFVGACENFIENECGLPIHKENKESWEDCYHFLVNNLPKNPEYDNFHLIFEYIMPDTNKRADVILLTQNKVLILEFKQKNKIKKIDISQATGYAQSIKYYHHQTDEQHMTVLPYLVLTGEKPESGYHSDLINVLWKDNFENTIADILKNEQPLSDSSCINWVNSPFVPLKNIAAATLQLFRDGELPNIKSIKNGDIQDTLTTIDNIIDLPGKNIIFISGVPGAGKTLVGLKTVYDHIKPEQSINPIYLSGNDPLINILQETLTTDTTSLNGKSYIQAMKHFKKNATNNVIPNNNIIVFDEAQRAWDIDYRKDVLNEADALIKIGDKIANKYGKVTILCLIGDGQAIHKHEESGMEIWKNILSHRADWNVYTPENYRDFFSSAPNCEEKTELMLQTSIRNDFINVEPLVEAILNLDLDTAKRLYKEMLMQGFKFWLDRKVEKLPGIVNWVKENYPNAHTGIILSSHLRADKQYFGPNYEGSYIDSNQAYNWYMNDSEKLVHGASEFLVQGIELDFPIVSFVGDYYIENNKWCVSSRASCNKDIKNLAKVIENVYRVLLTRSRKGSFLYIPENPQLDETYYWFKNMLSISE